MHASKLTGRVREILNPGPSVPVVPAVPLASAVRRTTGDHEQIDRPAIERTLGGAWQTDGDASSFVVERSVSGDEMHGHRRVRDLAAEIDAHAGHASLLMGPTAAVAAPPPFVFFDLETTGLGGGAGTYAFLVGCGTFADDGAFLVRQYLMTTYGDERPMLRAIVRDLDRAGALVSFNGKSFDAPVLETRYLFHRLQWAGANLPHLDVLHPARQFWGEPALPPSPWLRRSADQPPPRLRRSAVALAKAEARQTWDASEGGRAPSSCSLLCLEARVLGARRVGDVPGGEIPARYFRFIRSGDARPLAAVLEHNRLDLLSLAGLTARLLQLVAAGPGEAADAREALALGRVYSRSGLAARAHEAFARAVKMIEFQPRRSTPLALRMAALHALAICERRARRYEAAAARWRAILEMPECPSRLAREATEALAIHHEHRVRDLPVARAFALRGLQAGAGGSWRDAAHRRLARIDRKMEGAGQFLLE